MYIACYSVLGRFARLAVGCSHRVLRVMPKQRPTRAPSTETEPTSQPPAGRTPPADTSASPQRTGVDSRQRGWYWHWNGIVTQYAPLIGLKGVGLLNSYTVWTDRRDQSPTRGYAFPSQQSEAAFYGEDRSELITINKILVALDLIEIRKEMVQRTDPQGRRWKVPHNLYRVKDRPEGIELRAEDVLRVAELASKDAAVYRYVKRMFSGRFAPIDRDNVWHEILAQVADDPLWQQLTEKTAKIEARASARSRAGHKARSKQDDTSTSMDDPAAMLTIGQSREVAFDRGEHNPHDMEDTQTSVEHTNNGSGVQNGDVATGNNGSKPDVGDTNTGLQGGDGSSAEATNNGPASVVARSNATYYQETSTTTTTTTADEFAGNEDQTPGPLPSSRHTTDSALPEIGQHDEITLPAGTRPHGLDDDASALPPATGPADDRGSRRTTERSLADAAARGPLVGPSPLVVSLFEAANNRAASPLERTLLGELERDAAIPADRAGETGAEWVAAALREAVSSGSAFVAPKRIREIINRWASTGSRPGVEPPPSQDVAEAGTARAVKLPRGRSATRVWGLVLDELAGLLDAATHERLFSGSRIAGYRSGDVVIEVAAGAADKLSSEYRPMLQRHLVRHIGREVTVSIVAAAEEEPPDMPEPQVPIVISASDAEQGRQLWRAVLNEIRTAVNADDLARLGSSLPLGQDTGGSIVIGASSSLAARLIEGRCRPAIEAAMLAVLGGAVTIAVAASGTWTIDEDEAGR